MLKKMKKESKNIITIDATGKSLGRLASRIAFLLQDKHLSHYAPNKEGETIVQVKNLAKIQFPEPKLRTKVYYRHTPYLGHLKEISLAKMWKEDPAKVLRKAVRGMLPKNKLRDRRMKRLSVILN